MSLSSSFCRLCEAATNLLMVTSWDRRGFLPGFLEIGFYRRGLQGVGASLRGTFSWEVKMRVLLLRVRVISPRGIISIGLPIGGITG
jgi:hypothetical protein